MKHIFSFVLTCLCCSFLFSQSLTESFEKEDFAAIVKQEKNAEKLSPKELYMVGYAFFRLENDQKAIEFYDKAIAKGYDNGTTHFYKGISLRFLEKWDEALKEVELALAVEPTNQEFMNEKGVIYYSQKQLDKALVVFQEAKKLPKTFPESYYWIAEIYADKKDYKSALAAYYEAIANIPKENSYYASSLLSIGAIEYLENKNYLKSAKAYKEYCLLKKEDYEILPKLMASYNGAKEYKKADSVFKVLQLAYNKGKLPKEMMEMKSVRVHEFVWNGQIARVLRVLPEPKETIDMSYKVFLLTKEGDKVERRFVVEKTIQFEKNGLKHLLCEEDKKTGGHITYNYGWNTDIIPLEDLQKSVIEVLNGKIKAGASSNFGRK
jgi:tetratricopeptide (TPR) repeat protein